MLTLTGELYVSDDSAEFISPVTILLHPTSGAIRIAGQWVQLTAEAADAITRAHSGYASPSPSARYEPAAPYPASNQSDEAAL